MNGIDLDFDPLDPGADWFNRVFSEIGLDAEISGYSSKSIGTGQIGENVRFKFDFTRKGEGVPDTMVGKFASTDETSRAAAKQLGHYQREVFFYRTFPKVAGVITPSAYFTAFDEPSNRFALIMEDMAPSEQGDQLKGCGVSEAERAMAAAALLHGAYYQDETLATYDWLQGTPGAPDSIGPEGMAQLWFAFKDRYGEQVDDEDLDIGDKLVAKIVEWGEGYTGPRALTHSDYRLDNMLFGAPAAPKPLAVVDWQTAGYEAPAKDVAYFIGAGLTRDDRPKHEKALLDYYYGQLQAQGVSNYSFDDFYRDYRWFTFYGMTVAWGAAILVKQTERGDEMFLTMLRRHAAQVRDNDALALLY